MNKPIEGAKFKPFTVPQRITNRITNFLQDKSNLPVLILIIACYFIFFWRLGQGGVRLWDESSLAVNAFEMVQKGDPIVKYLDGKPDLINTKPMMAIWVIGLCMKVLGYTEFALRLPSALCAFATVIAIYAFCRYYLKNTLAALISGFVLITSIGFTGEHVARTGDYDAMLVLWITLYSLACFIYLDFGKPSQRIGWLAITTVFLIFAVWTKGIAGLMLVPGLFIYALYKRKLKGLLRSPHFYASVAIFLFFSLGYYVLREFCHPGYLQAVLQNELTGRYLDVVPGGTERGFSYYLINIIDYRFRPWFYLLPLCWIGVYTSHKKTIQDFSVFSGLYMVLYFFIISYSKSKFNWYDAPLYPIASLSIGLGLSTFLTAFVHYYTAAPRTTTAPPLAGRIQNHFISLSLICIFTVPYCINLYHEIYREKIPYRESEKPVTDLSILYRDYFQALEAVKLDTNSPTIEVTNPYAYNLPLLFYVQAAGLNKTYALKMSWENPFNSSVQNNAVLINCDSTIQKTIETQYVTKSLHHSNTCQTVTIESKKN